MNKTPNLIFLTYISAQQRDPCLFCGQPFPPTSLARHQNSCPQRPGPGQPMRPLPAGLHMCPWCVKTSRRWDNIQDHARSAHLADPGPLQHFLAHGPLHPPSALPPPSGRVTNEAALRRINRDLLLASLQAEQAELDRLRSDLVSREAALRLVEPGFVPVHGLPGAGQPPVNLTALAQLNKDQLIHELVRVRLALQQDWQGVIANTEARLRSHTSAP